VSDEIEFRRILAEPFPFGGRHLRDALDIYVNGASLSRQLGAAPFDIAHIYDRDLVRRWQTGGELVPIFNCVCGDADCGGFDVKVVAVARHLEWHPRWGDSYRVYAFELGEFRSSLRGVLSET
jgi:hypothetical protein